MAAQGQHQLLGFLIKRGNVNSSPCCFSSPCFSQQPAVPALCYASEVEPRLQLLSLHSVPPHGFLGNGNGGCSGLSSPLGLKPVKMKRVNWRDVLTSAAHERPPGREPGFFWWLFWVAFVKQKAFTSGNLVGHSSP